jgi:hypothetical protein
MWAAKLARCNVTPKTRHGYETPNFLLLAAGHSPSDLGCGVDAGYQLLRVGNCGPRNDEGHACDLDIGVFCIVCPVVAEFARRIFPALAYYAITGS